MSRATVDQTISLSVENVNLTLTITRRRLAEHTAEEALMARRNAGQSRIPVDRP